MGIQELLNAVLSLPTEPVYDAECERAGVAIKAIWLLYRRGNWNLLAGMGLERAEFERAFESFDFLHVVYERGRLANEQQAFALLRFIHRESPRAAVKFLSAAFWMVAEYRRVMRNKKGPTL